MERRRHRRAPAARRRAGGWVMARGITKCAVCDATTQRYPTDRKIPWVCNECRRKSDQLLSANRRYSAKVKKQIIKERGLICQDCGFKAARNGELYAHHIIPASHGGPTEPSNLALLCHSCHRAAHRNGPSVMWSAHKQLLKDSSDVEPGT